MSAGRGSLRYKLSLIILQEFSLLVKIQFTKNLLKRFKPSGCGRREDSKTLGQQLQLLHSLALQLLQTSMKGSTFYINHTLNTSAFRKACRFSTAPRFHLTLDSQTDFKYQIASKSTNRSTSFGIGPRPVTINSLHSPNPNRYNVSEFPNDKRATSLGQGRQKANFRSMIYDIEKKKQLPPPGAYESHRQNEGKSFTLRAKLPDETDRQIKKRVPGPGQYAEIKMNKQGKYCTSKIRNTRCINFGIPKKEEFNRSDSLIGPGAYDIFNADSDFSENRVKLMRRNTTKNFGTGHRMYVQDRSKAGNPGPGQYSNFSSFGA